ncbi:MAG: O-antigen polymerase [Candidatus Helarchaeota archaeon]
MVIIGIIGCFLILIFVHLALKDVLSPPFILTGIWLSIYLLLLFLRAGSVSFKSIYYLSFLTGLIFFVLGFFLIVINKNKNNCNIFGERMSNYRFKLPYIQIFILFAFILFFIYFLRVIQYVSQNFAFNFWYTLSHGKKTGIFRIPVIIEYSRSAIISLNIITGIVFFSNPSKRSKRYFLLSGIVTVFYVVTAGNRGAVFIWIIAITFSYLVIKNFENRKLFSVLLKLALVVLLIFFITNFAKYVYANQKKPIEFSQKIFKHYFASSPIAFVEWMKQHEEHVHGANTFRFFIAIYKSLGGNVEVPQTVQDPIKITKLGEETNVYTVLQYYAKDFGLIYAFLILFLLGMFYGALYKKSVLTNNVKLFYIALQAISYYPLLYQFFSDQYFTILSSWFQYVFWLWLFTRKEFLIWDDKRETNTIEVN